MWLTAFTLISIAIYTSRWKNSDIQQKRHGHGQACTFWETTKQNDRRKRERDRQRKQECDATCEKWIPWFLMICKQFSNAFSFIHDNFSESEYMFCFSFAFRCYRGSSISWSASTHNYQIDTSCIRLQGWAHQITDWGRRHAPTKTTGMFISFCWLRSSSSTIGLAQINWIVSCHL